MGKKPYEEGRWDGHFKIRTKRGKQFRGGGAVGRKVRVSADDKEYIQIAKDVVHSVNLLNEAWSQFGLLGEFDSSNLQNYIDQWESGNISVSRTIKDQYALVLSGKFKGVLTPEHILTISSVAIRYMDEEDRDALIWGPCQGAKTMVFVTLFLLLPILERAYHDCMAIPVINFPNMKNLELSTIKELEVVVNLYEHVTFNFEGECYPWTYVKDEIMLGVLKQSGDEKGIPTWNSLLLQRNSHNIAAFAQLAAKKMPTGVSKIINFGDEIHWGSGTNSVADKMEDKFQKVMKQYGMSVQMRRIGITATWSELSDAGKWMLVPMWIDENNYCGITEYNNMRLPTISGKRPPVQKIEAIEDKFPDMEKFLNLDRFCSEESFYPGSDFYLEFDEKQWDDLNRHERIQVKLGHEDYVWSFAKEIYSVYKSCVTKTYPIMFLRPFDKCDDCNTLYRALKDLAKENGEENTYHFLKYWGKLPEEFGQGSNRTESRTLKEVLIDEYVGKPGHFCLVIAAKGRSRMGDSYPKECRHFMDLVENSCTWNSIVQSTAGRSQGYGKKSICYFRKSYQQEFQKWILGGGHDTAKNFGSRDRHLDGKRGRPSDHVVLLFPEP